MNNIQNQKEDATETNQFKSIITIVAMVGTCTGIFVGFVSAAIFIVNC